MKTNISITYALLAIGYLAKNKKKKLVLSQDIAKKYDIPLEFLFKILQLMVKANIVTSKRGPQGGFALARPITKISMVDIIEALEGPMVGYLGLEEFAGREKYALKTEKAYEKIVAQTRTAFSKIKISQLL